MAYLDLVDIIETNIVNKNSSLFLDNLLYMETYIVLTHAQFTLFQESETYFRNLEEPEWTMKGSRIYYKFKEYPFYSLSIF